MLIRDDLESSRFKKQQLQCTYLADSYIQASYHIGTSRGAIPHNLENPRFIGSVCDPSRCIPCALKRATSAVRGEPNRNQPKPKEQLAQLTIQDAFL
ncbi:hypothetical protein CEXT_81921 [Caerostris extrusa]|uniref:Uncharacterized protein n=1 Tax=Caerostris extrusa TaxID=172846 RepID=A0AAV4NNQ9_CAEEX|nr:hypothetical protein CEXT_81921 [Caerostris extrusa]